VAGQLPEHVERFITDYVDSVELIEVLLLLKRSRTTEWTAPEVAERLYTSPGSAANRLEALRASRLAAVNEAVKPPSYRFAPATADLERTVNDLEREYATRRTSVINFIFSRPSSNLRVFADAFRIREDK
jgi:hypothetical protein